MRKEHILIKVLFVGWSYLFYWFKRIQPIEPMKLIEPIKLGQLIEPNEPLIIRALLKRQQVECPQNVFHSAG